MPRSRIAVRAVPPGNGNAPKLAGRALQLGAQQLPLYSGAVHYFRLKQAAWKPALEALKSLGLNMVETYVPWGVHELRDCTYDFGQYDPQKDLAAFLDLAEALGLFVFVRPGPNINAELTYFGLPQRIVFDEACQARSSRGRPLPFIAPPRMFAVPSLASERFLSETERWYAAVAEIVAPRVWPKGPVVLVQVDNEAAFYFRDAPYDHDHHPDALEKYATFLRERYPDLCELNTAYGTEFTDWREVAPLARCPMDATHAVLRRALDMMSFQEDLVVSALSRMRNCLQQLLGHLPSVHNVPLGEAGLPNSLSSIDRVVDINGLDYYHKQEHLDTVKERTLRLVGSVRFAYAPELGIGAPPWFAPRSEADALQTLLCACAYGIRGLNLYMAVDRDRWYGAPFDEMGRERSHAAALRRVIKALKRSQFHALERRVEVAIMLPKEYARLSRATHTLGALSPSLLAIAGVGANAACLRTKFDFESPVQIVWTEFVDQFARALARAGVPYVYVESDADEERLSELRVLICPNYEFADVSRLARLDRFAQRGGRVVFGPCLPRLDAALTALAESDRPDMRAWQVRDSQTAADTVQALISELDLATPFIAGPIGVETAVHEDETGAKLLFVVQPGAASVQAQIQLPEPMALIDVLTEDRYEGVDSVSLPVAGYSCRMFCCERAASARPRSRGPFARRSQPPC